MFASDSKLISARLSSSLDQISVADHDGRRLLAISPATILALLQIANTVLGIIGIFKKADLAEGINSPIGRIISKIDDILREIEYLKG